jgi:hypothetical protein
LQKVGGAAVLCIGIAYPEADADEMDVYYLHRYENKGPDHKKLPMLRSITTSIKC